VKSAEQPARTHRIPWADLLRKVYAIDVLACPECSGRMQLIAFIVEAKVAKRILDHLALDSTDHRSHERSRTRSCSNQAPTTARRTPPTPSE
jgi:uncharacterized protein YbaR (Trm112 family)